MTTSQIVQRILTQAPEWSPEGPRGILAVLNEVDLRMNEADIDQMLFIDSATGLPPFLATTSGTRFYELPTTCRKVQDIFIHPRDLTNDMYRYDKYYREKWYNGVRYYSIYNTSRRRSISAAGVVTAANITFPFNPGTTTEMYYSSYYRQPHEITSVNIQPNTLPAFHHLLTDGVFARIQYLQYGKEDLWLSWEQRMKMEYWSEMNDNLPHEPITSRPC